jgi:hypothetical protein
VCNKNSIDHDPFIKRYRQGMRLYSERCNKQMRGVNKEKIARGLYRDEENFKNNP